MDYDKYFSDLQKQQEEQLEMARRLMEEQMQQFEQQRLMQMQQSMLMQTQYQMQSDADSFEKACSDG